MYRNIFITLLGNRQYNPHFTDEETSSEIVSDLQKTCSSLEAPLRALDKGTLVFQRTWGMMSYLKKLG